MHDSLVSPQPQMWEWWKVAADSSNTQTSSKEPHKQGKRNADKHVLPDNPRKYSNTGKVFEPT